MIKPSTKPIRLQKNILSKIQRVFSWIYSSLQVVAFLPLPFQSQSPETSFFVLNQTRKQFRHLSDFRTCNFLYRTICVRNNFIIPHMFDPTKSISPCQSSPWNNTYVIFFATNHITLAWSYLGACRSFQHQLRLLNAQPSTSESLHRHGCFGGCPELNQGTPSYSPTWGKLEVIVWFVKISLHQIDIMMIQLGTFERKGFTPCWTNVFCFF